MRNVFGDVVRMDPLEIEGYVFSDPPLIQVSDVETPGRASMTEIDQGYPPLVQMPSPAPYLYLGLIAAALGLLVFGGDK